ncbi:MAG: YerC/YecD family TrpR-related protein [Candidatus Kuenenbacteria bacterium]
MIKESWTTKETTELFKAILSLKTVEECENFFRDLCTLEEIKGMEKRWQIARMLYQDIPYRDIAKELEVSSTTVSRVAQWLNHGANGYMSVLRKN